MRVLAALLRALRNDGTGPAQAHRFSPPAASSSPATRTPGSMPPGRGGGEGPDLTCSHTAGCTEPGTCTWEADGDLIRVCPAHCTYCNPGGDLDRIQRRLRLQQTGSLV